MTRKNKILATVAVMLLFAILPMTVVPSYAFTSPPTRFYGASTSEPQIFDGSSAVVEDQSITFDITEFSDVNEDDLITEQFGRVNTSYTLYNPTEEEINMTITLPISGVPQGYVNNENGVEADKYKFTVNGEVIEPTLAEGKYIDGQFGTIYPDTFILDEYIPNEHFNTDMPVTKYTFKNKQSKYNSSVVGVEIGSDTFKGSCLIFNKYASIYNRKNGNDVLNIGSLGSGKSFDVYVFGEPLTSLPKFETYTLYSSDLVKDADGCVEFISSETMTYDEFISRTHAGNSHLSEQFLYNIFAKEISNIIALDEIYSKTTVGSVSYLDCYSYKYYMETVLLYKFTIAPGERVTASLDAPLYPSIETKYVQNTYEYTYDLCNSNVAFYTKAIDVTINTPYYVVSDGTTEYAKIDGGYSLTANRAVFYNRINFTLCEVESPEEEKISEEGAVLFFILIILASIIMLVKSAIEAIPYIIGLFFENIFSWFSNFIGSLF